MAVDRAELERVFLYRSRPGLPWRTQRKAPADEVVSFVRERMPVDRAPSGAGQPNEPNDLALARGTLRQFIETGDGCYLDNADADTLREMVRLAVQLASAVVPAASLAGVKAENERFREALEKIASYNGSVPTPKRFKKVARAALSTPEEPDV